MGGASGDRAPSDAQRCGALAHSSGQPATNDAAAPGQQACDLARQIEQSVGQHAPSGATSSREGAADHATFVRDSSANGAAIRSGHAPSRAPHRAAIYRNYRAALRAVACSVGRDFDRTLI
ncbi:hypothetical protein F511_24419 [Dorcoceras hygrometricum]|uniref:Uncharacterized protein n=1 Tax=Dorcoceras hygrometricum TaxID=472368 RepID=A0A2Z7AUZ6_9LAMI|nr:hypothetical protein F511_24419 [Dorcoceras hygrometricum]